MSATDFEMRMCDAYGKDAWFLVEENIKDLVQSRGLWFKGDALVVPNSAELRLECLKEVHDPLYAGHFGRTKTRKSADRLFWWPSMHKDLEEYVKTCDVCERTKGTSQKPAGLLQPLQIPEKRWESVSVDFITHLPKTKSGHSCGVRGEAE